MFQSVKSVDASVRLKLYSYVHSSACECMCDVVKKLVFVKRLVFSGQRVSQGEELSAWLICAAGIRHKQRRPPMSNVTALISFQCSPGITAGARDRHTSLLHRMRFPGDSAIHKSTGFISMKSIVTWAQPCARFRNFLAACVMQQFSNCYRETGIVCLLISCTAAPFKFGKFGLYNCRKLFVFPALSTQV